MIPKGLRVRIKQRAATSAPPGQLIAVAPSEA